MSDSYIAVYDAGSVLTSVSQSSDTNDIIDLTEINESDECETNSSCSVIVSNISINAQNAGSRPARNRRKITNCSEDAPSSKVWSESPDDSICILYEKIQPPPDIVVVNEIIVDESEGDNSSNDFLTTSNPPVIMGDCIENPVTIPPVFPEISSEITSISSQPNNYRDHLRPSPPSCKYATRHTRLHPSVSDDAPCSVALQRISTTNLPQNSMSVPDNLPNLGLEQTKPNIEIKVPKIQCGICLDGPDEIAASNRNFVSTKCGHVFCNECLKTSMKTAAKCPKCRQKTNSRAIRPLYL